MRGWGVFVGLNQFSMNFLCMACCFVWMQKYARHAEMRMFCMPCIYSEDVRVEEDFVDFGAGNTVGGGLFERLDIVARGLSRGFEFANAKILLAKRREFGRKA